ncbi:MAG TPA: DNA polymerase ligase N-terminal domain-containing protein, partial [Acidimicrobiales bacterium]|nr:DNA polymerase ligase N-terminal domain-containing protein [Acidimicrobiales bacterium]
RFVVQEHHATALHWDFRLERDGVLVSWAVPKGLPPLPQENHLAVHTEDHPLDYLTFEGEIPEGEYGGGKVILWDQGTYDCEKWNDREVIVNLHGQRVQGRYALIKTRGRNWLMHRMDPPLDPTRQPLPPDLRPTRPTLGPLPHDEERWGFQVWWGGEHVLVASDGGRIQITDEPGADLTDRFPELSKLGRSLGALEVVLDGELVVTGVDIASRLGADKPSAIRRGAEQHPATFLAGDLVWLEGHPTWDLAATDRRRFLDQLALAGPQWHTVPWHPGDGTALLHAAAEQGVTGVLGKRLDSQYRPGEQTPDWVVTAVP